MKYQITSTSKYKRSLKKIYQTNKQLLGQLEEVIGKLADDIPLEAKHRDHALKGKLRDFRECHIQPDVLLIYQKQKDLLILTLVNIGSHAKLF